MELNESQRDALVELLNVGFGRAAAALSKLTGHRVMLEVPKVEICPVTGVSDALHAFLADNVASIHQVFTGPVAGDAVLILDEQAGTALKELLTGDAPLPLSVDGSAKEVLTEVGNILLNACLGTIGNVLNVHVSFSVPQLTLDTLTALLDSLVVGREGLRYALIVHAGFRVRDSEIQGYIVIVLSVPSFDRLLRAVQGWEEQQQR